MRIGGEGAAAETKGTSCRASSASEGQPVYLPLTRRGERCVRRGLPCSLKPRTPVRACATSRGGLSGATKYHKSSRCFLCRSVAPLCHGALGASPNVGPTPTNLCRPRIGLASSRRPLRHLGWPHAPPAGELIRHCPAHDGNVHRIALSPWWGACTY